MRSLFCASVAATIFINQSAWAQPASTAAPASTSPAAAPLVDGDALLIDWAPPVYPPELKAQNIQGSVNVQFTVDETGTVKSPHVLKSTDPRFEAAALAAVQQWKFEAAVEDGARIATCMTAPVVFKLPEPKAKRVAPLRAEFDQIRSLPKGSATAEFTPDPQYPAADVPRRLNAKVIFDLEVDKAGRVSNPVILLATHPDFVRPCLDALAKWTFKPGMQGDLPVVSKKRVPMSFDVYVPRLEDGIPSQLAANGFTLRTAEGETAASVCDIPPELVTAVDPVYPYELAAAGKPGEANADFTLNLQGRAESITVRPDSDPACGRALVAALEATVFEHALRDSTAVEVPMTKKLVFAPPSPTPAENEPAEARLIRRLLAGETIPQARGLDAKLHPLWRAKPEYPDALRAEPVSGSAEIEFIIDREGRARLPRIVSASREEFGWAAATAISQWVFDPPKKDGQPIDVRVRIPVSFPPP